MGVAKSLPILALAIVLALSPQAYAFSSTLTSDLPDTSSVRLEEVKSSEWEYEEEEEDNVDAWEHEEWDEDEDYDEDEIDELDDDEEEEDDEDLEYENEDALNDVEENLHEEDEFDEDDAEEEDDLEYDHEEELDEEGHDFLEDNLDEDEEENLFEDEAEEEFDDDEEDADAEEDEDDWTTEEYEEMDILYSRYLKEIARRYGSNWRDEYELVVDKEVIYERYLEFEERKLVREEDAEERQLEEQKLEKKAADRHLEEQRLDREAEERRLITQASHTALVQHEEAKYYDQTESMNRTDEEISLYSSANGNAMVSDSLPRRDVVVLNTGLSYYSFKNFRNKKSESRAQECPASTHTMTPQQENCQNIVGSI